MNILDIYLDEPTLDVDITECMDVFEWWKSNSQHFSDFINQGLRLAKYPNYHSCI